jgi:hypothetical protein
LRQTTVFRENLEKVAKNGGGVVGEGGKSLLTLGSGESGVA